MVQTIKDMEVQSIPPEALARVRKILAIAEIKGGEDVEKREGEIANALALSARIMAEFNIQMSDIEALTAEAKREEEQNKRPTHKLRQVADSSIEMQWKRALGNAIATSNFCDLLSNRSHFWVIGRPHNVAMVNELIDSVFPQVESLAAYASSHRKKTGKTWEDYEITRIPTPTYRLSYCLGVASRVGSRLSAQRHTDEVELKGTTALVLDTKGANKKYMEETWPKVFGPNAKGGRGGGRRGNQTDSRAWAHGYAEADRVDVSVNARRVAGKTIPALGNGR